SEHARVTNLNPFIKTLMEAENFHGRLGVWVISRFESQLVHSHLCKEGSHETNQVTQSQTEISNDTLDLMELGQMCGVDGLVTEDSVNREVFRGDWVLCELVEHGGRNGSRVGTEDEAERFVFIPWVTVTDRAVFALLVYGTHVVPVILKELAILVPGL